MLGLIFIGVYVSALRRNINEKNERSLQLRDGAAISDRVRISIVVVRADPTTRQLTARLRFQPLGNIAQDPATPKVDLRLLVNNSLGQRIFQFPKGQAINRIEVTLPMEGDINRYPFDRYETNLWLLIDTPDKSKSSKEPKLPPATPSASAAPPATVANPAHATRPVISEHEEIPPAEIAALVNRRVPISISLLASTPGLKYSGKVILGRDVSATLVQLNLQRAYNVVNVSIIVMCLMMGIALSIVAMVLRTIVIHGQKLDVLPLSLTIGLIFGLPALRNIQPGVPPVGVLGDYFSFVWAEIFVASAAIIMALTWVFRTTGPKK